MYSELPWVFFKTLCSSEVPSTASVGNARNNAEAAASSDLERTIFLNRIDLARFWSVPLFNECDDERKLR